MNGNSVLALAVLLFLFWLLQGFLTFRQSWHYWGRMKQLMKLGRVASGVAGNIYKTKVYVTLVANDEDRIVRAEKLSGWTVFARSKPVPMLEGMALSELLSDSVPGLSPKLHSACRMAAEALLKKREPEGASEVEESAEPGQADSPLASAAQ